MGHRKPRPLAGLRTFAAAAALIAAFPAVHAQDAREQARNAAVADGVSTAVGLALGAAEMNPLGPVLAVGMKVVALNYVDKLPDVEQPEANAMMASVWSGFSANNVCITAAILTGGGFAPACVALGLGWGMKTWKDTEQERQFWEGCATLRAYSNLPELPCVYMPTHYTIIVPPDFTPTVMTAEAPDTDVVREPEASAAP
ncbi:MAG TPA: hypothetical protein VF522_13380 [Ramlibacter sp.]|uniref:hypothetical protein n=1 Tax=Ramlibacter sp. TaxID=1917967 RepID=UPI002ED395A6